MLSRVLGSHHRAKITPTARLWLFPISWACANPRSSNSLLPPFSPGSHQLWSRDVFCRATSVSDSPSAQPVPPVPQHPGGSWGPLLPGGGWDGAVKPHWAEGQPRCHRSLRDAQSPGMALAPPRDTINPSGKPSVPPGMLNIPGMLLVPLGMPSVYPLGHVCFGPLWGRTHSKSKCKQRDGSLLHPLTH